VERFGKPTWNGLVEAVGDPVGGNNHPLAQTIAKEHPGAPGNWSGIRLFKRSSLS